LGGYRTAVSGTTITASDQNTYVRDQVVSQFVTKAARDSAITTPVAGMLAYTADLQAFSWHNGTLWAPAPGAVLISPVQTLGSDTATVTFSSIPGDFRHLQLVAMVRSTRPGNVSDTAVMTINGDSGSHYEWATSVVNNVGTTASSGVAVDTALRYMQAAPATNAATNVFGRVIIDFPLYADTSTLAKSVIASGAGPGWPIQLASANWVPTSSAAITSIALSVSTGNNKASSVFALYGIA
jgi:hypothetical protein